MESIGTGIRVTLIEPGRVDTELRTHVRRGGHGASSRGGFPGS